MAKSKYKILEKKNRTVGGKKAGVTLTRADVKTGETSQVTLLNPHGKGAKYAAELRRDEHLTNEGRVKRYQSGKKQGQPVPLSDVQRAFRSGYLQAQSDSAKAYKAQKGGRSMSGKRF